LITDGTVERVVGEEELHDSFPVKVEHERNGPSACLCVTPHIRVSSATHLALCTNGVLVNTLLPGMAGIAHDATGLGDRSTCTYNHMEGSASTSLHSTFVRHHWKIPGSGLEDCSDSPQQDTFDSYPQ
jgi:hypothetical protein